MNDRTIDANSEYPFEGYQETGIFDNRVTDNSLDGFTQPTTIGFYAQLLGDLAAGELLCDYITSEQAIERIDQISHSLLEHQSSLSDKHNLLPWISVNNSGEWERASGDYGQQAALIDNANLTASLAVLYGALLSDTLIGHQSIYGTSGILSRLDTFLENQGEGYRHLYNAEAGLLNRVLRLDTDSSTDGSGQHWFYGSEERSATLLIALLYPEKIPESIYFSTAYKMKTYTGKGEIETIGAGETRPIIAHHTGAFQMLWPSLTMPEINSPALNQILQEYIEASIDFSYQNSLPGFLSASYVDIGVYDPAQGINEISLDTSTREDAATIYTVGAAYPFKPELVNTFLEWIWQFYQQRGHELLSDAGMWEGFNKGRNETIKVQLSANISSFVLGIIGKGPEHMLRFLEYRNGLSPDAVNNKLQRHPLAHRMAWASSAEQNTLLPCYAIDGDPSTRWSSLWVDLTDPVADDQSLTIRYVDPVHFDTLRLLWTKAYGSIYTIEVSNDGEDWESLFQFPDNENHTITTEIEEDDSTTVQHTLSLPEVITTYYIRIKGIERATEWGYSIREVYTNLSIKGWKTQHFSEADLDDPNKEPTLWGDLADPDQDGNSNLIEYALGMDPHVSDHGFGEISLSSDLDMLFYTSPVAKYAQSVDIDLWSSDDLATWTFESISPVIEEEHSNYYLMRWDLPLSTEEDSKFTKLGISTNR